MAQHRSRPAVPRCPKVISGSQPIPDLRRTNRPGSFTDARPGRTFARVLRTSRVLVLCVGFSVVGCGSEPAAPEPEQTTVLDITTDAASYSAGSAGTVIARNKAADAVLLDLCLWELDRRTDDWQAAAVRPEGESACPLVLAVLQPGQTATRTFELPANLPAGEYRLRYERIFDTEMEQLPLPERVSRSFKIDS